MRDGEREIYIYRERMLNFFLLVNFKFFNRNIGVTDSALQSGGVESLGGGVGAW